jgi:hypothetical protein
MYTVSDSKCSMMCSTARCCGSVNCAICACLQSAKDAAAAAAAATTAAAIAAATAQHRSNSAGSSSQQQQQPELPQYDGYCASFLWCELLKQVSRYRVRQGVTEQ